MRILLIAIDTPPHLGVSFKTALREMDHEVRLVDQRWAYSFLDRWPLRLLARRLLGPYPSRRAWFRWLLLRECAGFKPDLVLATQGMPLDRELMNELRVTVKVPLAVFSTDNPFNPIVSNKGIVEALPLWDVVFTPRRSNISILREHCRRVIYLPFGYDPALHYPESPATNAEAIRFQSDVVFLGGCDADRIPYLDPLARCENLNVGLYGGYYHYTKALRRCHKGEAIGRHYRLALNMTQIALCLVRRANADGHVMRTFEVPACGAFMLAERTDEHEEMFQEDREAVFFDNPDEMIDKIKYYLSHDVLRRKVAEGGYARVTAGHHSYADRLSQLLKCID